MLTAALNFRHGIASLGQNGYPMGYAALRDTPTAGKTAMNVSILVNAKGKICMTHDYDFGGIPLWVKYRRNAKEIDIIFDDGSTKTVVSGVNNQIDSYLVNANKVLLMRIEDRLPVEGWDTILLNDLN